MPRLLSFLLSLLLVFAARVIGQQPPAELTQSSTAETPVPAATASLATTTDATLNIHRWGAITLFHGLPSDRVRALAADAQGALWIGTEAGLVRYDGRTVEAFAQESALPAHRILALAFDRRGSLWVGTEAGAVRIHNDQVHVLEETRQRSVTGIACSLNGDVVLVTAQGDLLRYSGNDTTLAQGQNASAPRFSVERLDATTHPLLRLADQNNQAQPLRLNCVIAINNNEFRLGSNGRGVLVYQPKQAQAADKLRELTVRPPRPYFINALLSTPLNNEMETLWIGEQSGRTPGLWRASAGTSANASLQRLASVAGEVTALAGDARELWIGTQTNGAYLLREGSVLERLTFESTAGGLRSNYITAVLRDRDGVLWFGTERGLCRYDRDSFRAATLNVHAQSNFVRTLWQTTRGELFSGTNRGLFKLAAGADLGPWLPASELPELSERAIYALHETRDGTLYIGTNRGIIRLGRRGEGEMGRRREGETERGRDGETENQKQQTKEPGQQTKNNGQPTTDTGQKSNPQPAIRNPQAEDVRAFAAFRGQLYAANFARGVERVTAAGELTSWPLAQTITQPVSLLNENDTTLWIGTAQGKLWRVTGETLSAITLPDKQAIGALWSLAVTGGKLWLGTARGLFARAPNGEWQTLQPEANVMSMLVTQQNGQEVLWCATQNLGVLKWLPQSGWSMRFDTQQGLASQQAFALAADRRTGELWIGTARGVVRHQPQLAPPRLELRRLVADDTYRPEYLTAELSLPATQRNFLLEVTALGSRTFPSQFQYEFTIQRRSGEEARTVRSSEPQFAVDNLRAGPYTVIARAISRDLVPSEPLTLKLRVRNAPFPWTTIFLTALLVMASLAAYWFFRQRKRLAQMNASLATTNVELRETRLRLARETEAERARIARDLHDQTLGDLRQLLVLTDQLPVRDGEAPATTNTAANTLADKLAGEKDAPTRAVLRGRIEAISREIRHICEDLSPSVLENIGFLPALEWALSAAIAPLPAPEKFTYEFHCAADLEDRLTLTPIEQIQLYRMVQEALNNIARHAHARHVRLRVLATTAASDATTLRIEIDDDGIGFDGEAETVTGHGVANIRSRANLIGATVAWQRLTPGCRVTVTLPNAVAATAATTEPAASETSKPLI